VRAHNDGRRVSREKEAPHHKEDALGMI